MTYRMTWRAALGRVGLAVVVPFTLLASSPISAHAQRRESTPFDTLPARRRPVAIEYSDWYARRLKVHQVASWAMLPLFAVQYSAGQQLLDKGKRDAPQWARDWHGPLAGATGALFAVNTLTGGWNLWDARKDPKGRKWRTAHAVLMLVADAGFAITPAFAEDDDEGGGDGGSRLQTHKTMAITSMGIAAASWLMMLPPFRRE